MESWDASGAEKKTSEAFFCSWPSQWSASARENLWIRERVVNWKWNITCRSSFPSNSQRVVNLSRLFILLLREFSLISCSWCASAAFDVSIKSQKWKNGFLIAHFWWTSENKSPHQLTPSVNWRLLQLVWIWSTLWSIKPETVKARATNDFRTTWPRLGIASNVDWSHKFYNHLLVTTASDLDWLICLRR